MMRAVRVTMQTAQLADDGGLSMAESEVLVSHGETVSIGLADDGALTLTDSEGATVWHTDGTFTRNGQPFEPDGEPDGSHVVLAEN
jgi:hypothetical protein